MADRAMMPDTDRYIELIRASLADFEQAPARTNQDPSDEMRPDRTHDRGPKLTPRQGFAVSLIPNVHTRADRSGRCHQRTRPAGDRGRRRIRRRDPRRPWAAVEAHARKVPLKLVHVIDTENDFPFVADDLEEEEAAVGRLSRLRGGCHDRGLHHRHRGGTASRPGQSGIRRPVGEGELAGGGSVGAGFFERMVLGSTALSLAHHAKCTVAVVRGADGSPVRPRPVPSSRASTIPTAPTSSSVPRCRRRRSGMPR